MTSLAISQLWPNRARSQQSGNVLLTGYFHGEVEFGNHIIGSAGVGDAFVIQLEP